MQHYWGQSPYLVWFWENRQGYSGLMAIIIAKTLNVVPMMKIILVVIS